MIKVDTEAFLAKATENTEFLLTEMEKTVEGMDLQGGRAGM